MEEKNGQTAPQTASSLEQVSDYLSVSEAAKHLGVSERSVYGYLASKKLPGGRIGKFIVVQAQGLAQFETQVPGRQRMGTPCWRKPRRKKHLYVTTVTVRVRAGQGELFDRTLADMRRTGRHTFAGTAARFLVQNQQATDEIDILLIWRSAVIPSGDVREAAFAALCLELAEVCDWETATRKEGLVLLYA